MKVLIVGGVAGGAGAAARLRRNDDKAEIILFEKGSFISFANCGLPYYIGGALSDPVAPGWRKTTCSPCAASRTPTPSTTT